MDALLAIHHVVQDRLADVQLVAALRPFAMVEDLRSEFVGISINKHDAATIGLDPFEDQLHDALQQLVDIQCVAYGQRRSVHDL